MMKLGGEQHHRKVWQEADNNCPANYDTGSLESISHHGIE
jgi:hypothetical protein